MLFLKISISLQANDLQDEGATAIAMLAGSLPRLEFLKFVQLYHVLSPSLSSNSISQSGVSAIVAGLRGHASLKTLECVT